MNKLFGRISDRLLGLVVPKVQAQACSVEPAGCCDFCYCRFCCSGTGNCWCAGCSCTRC